MPFDDFKHEEVYYNYEIPHGYHYADDRYLSHETPAHYVDDRYLSHETPAHYADDRYLSHETLAHYAYDRYLSHEMPEHYVDDRQLPHRTPAHYSDQRADHYADKMHLPQQTLEHYGDNKRYFSHQTEEHYADTKRYFAHQTDEHYADKKRYFSPQTKEHYADKKRYFSPQLEEHYVDKKRYFSPQLEEHYADKKRYFSPQTEEHYADKKRYFSHRTEEHCANKKSYFSPQMEEHRAGKKRYFPHQIEERCAGKKRYFAHQKSEDYGDKRYLAQQKLENSGDKRHLRHQMSKDYADNRRLPHRTQEHYADKKRYFAHLKSEDYGDKRYLAQQKLENSGDKRHLLHQKSKDYADNRRLPHRTQEHYADEKRYFAHQKSEDYGDKRYLAQQKLANSGDKSPVKSSKPVVNAQVFTPAEAEGSTFEPKNHIDSQRKVTEAKEHHEVLNYGVDSNDERQSISMEFHYSAGSNTQIEVVNSNSAANDIVIEPLSSAPSDAVGSSFEPLIEHGLHTEIEPQEEAGAYYESQHPNDETDIELLPSVVMEIDAHSESSVETETADGSSQDEVDTDVLSNESGITMMPQVSVCLTCGHEGFLEALVYCKKCEDCALHRYCLDGPVIFTDEVIWSCEDCEAEVTATDYSDSETKDSEKGEVDSNKECFTVVDPQPIADAIWSGSLQILNKSYDNIARLMCHLSTLACPKVLKSTRHLPNVLYADMIQRSVAWPESFRKFGTNNLSIGLYFFPQNERVERYFDQLVDEMISNDLAIRARVENAELLIFPSTMLPSQYKRFQSKYYLWGVFKKAIPSTTCEAD
ncbi:unnamed protein product [Trifolium pratense]|nr:unnamed protein product [Trifolium pratense]